jgi:hypothetical protein
VLSSDPHGPSSRGSFLFVPPIVVRLPSLCAACRRVLSTRLDFTRGPTQLHARGWATSPRRTRGFTGHAASSFTHGSDPRGFTGGWTRSARLHRKNGRDPRGFTGGFPGRATRGFTGLHARTRSSSRTASSLSSEE